jgi:hypothetical protein
MGLCVMVVFLNLTHQTVLSMTFDFDWLPSPMTMPHFCGRLLLLSIAAIIVPALAMGLNDKKKSSQAGTSTDDDPQDLVLPGGVTRRSYYDSIGAGQNDGDIWLSKLLRIYVKPVLFSSLFVFVVTFLAAAELVVREQDWSIVNVGSDVVYPSYLMTGSSLLAGLTAMHLFSIDKIGRLILWIVIVVQGSKLLHLADVPSVGIFATIVLILSYTIPFVLHYTPEHFLESGSNRQNPDNENSEDQDYLDHPKDADRSGYSLATFTANPIRFVLIAAYMIVAGLAKRWALSTGIVHDVLEAMLLRDPSKLQQFMACGSVWFLFSALIFQAFFLDIAALRRYDDNHGDDDDNDKMMIRIWIPPPPILVSLLFIFFPSII